MNLVTDGKINTSECIKFFENQIHELDDMDLDFDYFDFDTDETMKLFQTFCEIHKINYEICTRYSAKTNSQVKCGKVAFGTFDQTVLERNPELDGNITYQLTTAFMNSIMM